MASVRRKSTRINPYLSSRNQSGRFKRICSSSIHDPLTEESSKPLIDLIKRPKISSEDFNLLKQKGIINKGAKFICEECIAKSQTVRVPEDDSQEEILEDTTGGDNVDQEEIWEDITDDESDSDSLTLKCIEVGKEVKYNILSDIGDVDTASSIRKLSDFNPLVWLSQRPPELVQLLGNLCNIDVNVAKTNKLVLLCKIIELIYYCNNSKKVLPCHFLESLLCYSFSNSKSYMTFMGNRSPGGSYTYLSKWLKDQSKKPLKYPAGLVKSVFDNSQKVGKTYLISETNVVPTSVITSHLWITLDKFNNLQENKRYQPGKWMWKEVDKVALKSALTAPTDKFRQTRNKFISLCIDIVSKQHGKLSNDAIDSEIKAEAIANSRKVCITCQYEADVKFRHCHNCGGEIIKETYVPEVSTNVQIDPYEGFVDFLTTVPKIICQTGEPDFINPNGYNNIIQVIQGIDIRAGIKQYGDGSREWLLVECDGLPYNLIREIIANVWKCSQCLCCYYGLETFKEHKCYILSSIEPIREFRWLQPVSGLLHIEMNIARSFNRLNWEVYQSKFGNILGFQSPKAQAYLKKGSEHHKLWHLLEIDYISLSLELMVPYVRFAKIEGFVPTTEGYWEWSTKIEDPNYLYIQETTLSYLHGLMMLRSGKKIFPYWLKLSFQKQITNYVKIWS